MRSDTGEQGDSGDGDCERGEVLLGGCVEMDSDTWRFRLPGHTSLRPL